MTPTLTADDLGQLMRAYGYTDATLADRLGVSSVTVYRWRTDRVSPPPYMEITIRALGAIANA